VCAYDVDWWFRWSSTQEVGCAFTDIDGAFEIKFRWCCGWWPWWWWKYREWRLDPLLADHIGKWHKRFPDLPLVPTPGEQPTLTIFKVTLDVQEIGTVIVDENVIDTRWNIPTTLDVTLVANEDAFCRDDGQELPCEDERCLVYTRVCNEFMLFRLNSTKFPDGTYNFRVIGYERNAAGNLVNAEVLPLCCTEDENELTLTFDNRVIDPMLDTASNPCSVDITNCTVHMCTSEPTTDFKSVRIDGTAVDPCDEFEVSDPGNHLAYYSLFAKYKENLYVDLLSLLSEPGASLTTTPGNQVGPTYGQALGQGATAPHWGGGTMTLTVPADKAFPEPCCYQLELRALKRTLVNCNSPIHYGHCNLSEYTLGVGVCPPGSASPPVVKRIDTA
jgi:hypothetical protein